VSSSSAESSPLARGAREPPPGYRVGPTPHASTHAWRLPFYFSVAAALVLGLSWHQVCVRQALAYASPNDELDRWLATLLGLFALGLGLCALRYTGARARPETWLPPLFLGSALAVAASATLLFVGFGSPAQPWLGAALSFATGLALGATSFAAERVLRASWRQFSLLERLLEPFRLALVVLVAIVAATLLPLLGFLRSACLASGFCALLGFWHLALHAYLERRRLPHARRWQLGFVGWAALMGAGLVLSEHWVSRSETSYFQGAILHTQKSQRSELVVTTGPLGVQLFVNRALRAADVDQHRYFEALVHPAFAATHAAPRVLALGAGDGFVESEVLAYPEVRRLDVVTEDVALAAYAARAPWLVERTRNALSSPHVHLIEAEAIVWLEASRAAYDVIVVDLPDPSLPRWGKNYTRYFFERIRAHLTPEGVVAVQAGSSQGTPKAFANVRATMSAAGLHTLPYHVAVPSIGDWGFVLGSPRPVEHPNRLRTTTRSLTNEVLHGAFFVPRDSRAEPGAPSTLDNQRVISLFLHPRSAPLSH